jgi:glutaredoxin 3
MAEATVWSKDTCSYCDLAIKELQNRKYKVVVKKLNKTHSKEDLLKVVPNARTVPQIFIDDKYVGGYNDLMKYFSSL